MVDFLSAAFLKGSSELVDKLANNFIDRAIAKNQDKAKIVATNLAPHIDATFNKCRTIKTLLNPNSPSEFLEIYSTQRFHCNGTNFDHYSLVETFVSDNQNFILTGTGGSGKSMFTRYLWLSLFGNSNGRYPLYIELRHLNILSSDNLLSYIFHTVISGSSHVNDDDFYSFFLNGDFILILDGFDEVSHQIRDSVQRQIMALVENYPKTKVFLTSRPDGRFQSWTTFHVVNVLPQTKEDVLELVSKSDFDADVKKSFSSQIEKGTLFRKHNSFLTNPLLSSMMLLTYSHNFDIPDKMHLFYQQAYNALYQRHDNLKPGGFKRDFHCKISEDSFKRTFAYFCLLSYYDQVFSFDRDKAIRYISLAIKAENLDIDAGKFLDDLCESVCMLTIEGLEYTFSHRSFQEYFAAYCLAYVTQKSFAAFCIRFSKRINDQALILLSDMNPELIRRSYIIPTSDQFRKELQIEKSRKSVERFYESCGKIFRITFRKIKDNTSKNGKTVRGRETALIDLTGNSQLYDFVSLLERLAGKNEVEMAEKLERMRRDENSSINIRDLLRFAKNKDVAISSRGGHFFYHSLERDAIEDDSKLKLDEGIRNLEADKAFKSSFMFEFYSQKLRIATTYISDAREADSISTGVLEEMLHLSRENSL